MKILSTIIIALATLVLGCQQKKPFHAQAIEIEITQMLHAYNDSVRKNGIEAEFYFLDSSDVFYWVPPNYKYALGYDSIASILRSNAPKFKYIDNQWDNLRVMPLSEKYASFNGIIISTSITSENDTINRTLSETGIIVKDKKRWKLLSGQTSVVD